MAAYRLPYLLAGDSVVFKVDSAYYEHFYKQLRAWEHYVPVRADLGDLLEKIQWARDHDSEVRMKIKNKKRSPPPRWSYDRALGPRYKQFVSF